MKKADVKVFKKVVPIRKSAWGTKLSESNEWRYAKEKGQRFLFVAGWDTEESAWLLSCERIRNSGDFFKSFDFKPYEPK